MGEKKPEAWGARGHANDLAAGRAFGGFSRSGRWQFDERSLLHIDSIERMRLKVFSVQYTQLSGIRMMAGSTHHGVFFKALPAGRSLTLQSELVVCMHDMAGTGIIKQYCLCRSQGEIFVSRFHLRTPLEEKVDH